MKNFDFDKAPVVEPQKVRYRGINYQLRDATAGAGAKYRNFQLDGITLENGKPKKLHGLASGEILLVAECLFAETDEAGKYSEYPVAQKHLESWPEAYVRDMADWIKDVSNLNESDKTIVDGLKEAFDAPGSPSTFERIQEHVLSLEDTETLKPIREMFKPDEEERAKN